MRKTILMVMLAVVSGPAAAEWIIAAETSEAVSYFNPATIRRSGDTAKMWRVMAFKVPRRSAKGKMYWSSKTQDEFDCKNERWRSLYLSLHFGKMGDGETVFSFTDTDEWTPIVPDSLAEANWKIACAKK